MNDTVERMAGKPHSNKPGKRMLTTREAAERLGIKVDSVSDAANRGLMTGARKVDGLWVIPEQAVAPLQAEIERLQAEVERLKSMTAVTMGIGRGDGNLFVHGDYDSIKVAQSLVSSAELREKNGVRQ